MAALSPADETRPIDPVRLLALSTATKGPRSKLAPAVGMNHHGALRLAPCDRLAPRPAALPWIAAAPG